MCTLKELLFKKTAQALKAYNEVSKGTDLHLAVLRGQSVLALYDVIETAGLEDEYQSWEESGA